MVPTKPISQNDTIGRNQSGITFILDNSAGAVVTLPPPLKGLEYEFIVETAPTTGDYSLYSHDGSSIIHGSVMTNNVTSATDGDATLGTPVPRVKFKANTAVRGDSLEIRSDGTKWYATAFCSVYNAIVFNADPSNSASPSASQSFSPSVSKSASPSVSVSLSPSASPSVSKSASPSQSPSASVSPSISPSVSPSRSPSVSPSVSRSASPS